jgi:hypothetical protein
MTVSRPGHAILHMLQDVATCLAILHEADSVHRCVVARVRPLQIPMASMLVQGSALPNPMLSSWMHVRSNFHLEVHRGAFFSQTLLGGQPSGSVNVSVHMYYICKKIKSDSDLITYAAACEHSMMM